VEIGVTIDRGPQRLIKIEVKVVETSLDPKVELRIDWFGLTKFS